MAHKAMMLPITYSTANVVMFFLVGPPIRVKVPWVRKREKVRGKERGLEGGSEEGRIRGRERG